ncbi:NAD(P)H-binding protein [Collimonas silvisoli]|uniref:NAD(P)H-binding protein n=1 Tax=Collimonas silvisoli TaxID=2825884 RepID=UPI001B8BA887|nr:NAD(P)H-binding protein [Collimonas silvisoli]
MYVIIGANGQIGRKLLAHLVKQGAPVRAITQNADAFANLTGVGVDARIGDAADVTFLTKSLEGTHVLFTLTPPNFAAPSHSIAVDRFGSAVTAAIAASGVSKVVNLSSAAATLAHGTGPIEGLYRQEQRLNSLADVDVLHLRPASFMENLLFKIGPMQHFGVFPDMMDGDVPFPMVCTADIALAAATALMQPDFSGKSAQYLLGNRDYTMRESASILAAAVGRPDIPYVQAAPADAKAALVANGFSIDVANKFEEMAMALSSRRIQDCVTRTAGNSTTTSLETWSSVFAAAYRSS